MSFFIITPTPTHLTEPNHVEVLQPVLVDTERNEGAIATVKRTVISSEGAIAPPVPIDPSAEVLRFFLIPLDPFNDPELVGIKTQRFGRTYWMYLSMNETYKLRFTTQPQSYPTTWKVIPASTSGFYYLYNTTYGRYISVDGGIYCSAVNTPDASCQFDLKWKTCCGPVQPTTGLSPQYVDKYFIISVRYGKALTSSTSSPYLSLSTIDYTSPNQVFFYRSSQLPTVAQPYLTFGYNMYFAASQGTMLCFTNTDAIETRTTAGSWEQLMIKPAPNNDRTFQICSYEFNSRLRASTANSVDLVSASTSAVDYDDCFVFVPYHELNLSEEKCKSKI